MLTTRGVIYAAMTASTKHFGVAGSSRKLLLAALVLFLLVISAASWWWLRHIAGASPEGVRASASTAPKNAAGVGDPRATVACLGHIEPQNGVLRISAAYLDGRPQRVSELKVKQGDRVSAQQVLAILDGNSQLQTSVRVADAKVDLAQAKLSQIKAGSSEPEIAAQKAEVEQLQAALENAREEYARYAGLRKNTDVSAAELESRALAVTTTTRKLEQAQAHLKDISQVRTTDLDIAESELRVAVAQSEAARTNLNAGVVRSPIVGEVLRILAHEGEEVGTEGLLDLGKTDSMYVVAEVYETDVARVRPAQLATITSDLFPGKMTGVVEVVGTTLAKNDVLPLDPVAFADARVFKVWIRLNEGERVTGLIHGKVNVVIQP